LQGKFFPRNLFSRNFFPRKVFLQEFFWHHDSFFSNCTIIFLFHDVKKAILFYRDEWLSVSKMSKSHFSISWWMIENHGGKKWMILLFQNCGKATL
jgi:hypothetical protein